MRATSVAGPLVDAEVSEEVSTKSDAGDRHHDESAETEPYAAATAAPAAAVFNVGVVRLTFEAHGPRLPQGQGPRTRAHEARARQRLFSKSFV